MYKILFIVDGPLDRPLLHSQGIPLLRRLGELGHSCWVLSFENNEALINDDLMSELSERGVRWVPLMMRNGVQNQDRMSMVLKGFLTAFRLCKKEQIDIVHCRSYRPAVIANFIKSLLRTGFLFDMRGFLIDEQILLGRWKSSGLKYRMARYLEKLCLLNADAIVTTSPQFSKRVFHIPYLKNTEQVNAVISIPNCVDTSKFRLDEVSREKLRQQMNWQGRMVMTFIGEVRAWEDFDQMISFHKMMREIDHAAFLALLVYGDLERLHHQLDLYGLSPIDYCVMSLPPKDVPFYLSASDIGLLFRKENPFTKEIASPVKFAEYLASGLPVVINPGVGDTERIIHQYQIGVTVDPSNSDDMQEAVAKIIAMLRENPNLRQRCHQVAEQELSLTYALQGYLKVYDLVENRRTKRVAN